MRSVVVVLILLSLGCGEAPLAEAVPEPVVDASFEEPEPEALPPPLAVPPEPVVVEPVSVTDAISVAQMRATMRRRRWRAPSDPGELAIASQIALLSVCAGEEGWASPLGCKMIWQVAYTIRGCVDGLGDQRPCRHPQATRQRETRLSALRRLSPRHTGAHPARTRRQRWTSTLTLDCEQPSGWPRLTSRGTPYAQWRSYQPLCEALVEQIRLIVAGDDALSGCPDSSRPVTWGCGVVRRLAIREVLGRSRPIHGCDDSWIADRRQLERLDCGETENAVWCRSGSPHCGALPASERTLLERLSLPWSATGDEVIEALASEASGREASLSQPW